MKKLITFVAPILPGKTENWKSFMNELKTTRLTEFTESRKKMNVHERTYLQTTPNGDFVIVTLEGNDPETAFKNFTKETTPFAKWFLSNVKEIHGMDINNMPEMPTLIIDSETTKTPAYTSTL